MSERDAYDRYAPSAKFVLDHAVRAAEHFGSRVVQTHHLLYAITLAKHTRVAKVLRAYQIEDTKMRAFIQFMEGGVEEQGPEPAEGYIFSKQLQRCLGRARQRANELGTTDVEVDHLGLALLEDTTAVAYEGVRVLGASPEAVRDRLLADLRQPTTPSEAPAAPVKKPAAKPKREAQGVTAGGEATESPVTLLIDMVEQARTDRLDRVIGREKELKRLMQILVRRTKNNPVLLGDPGVGKTAIVEGLAQAIAAGVVPPMLREMRVYALDVAAIVAGTKYRGELEEKVRRLLDELRARKNTILFIDEIHTVVGAGRADGALDVANILKPHLAKGELRCIGSTTWTEYRKYIERDPALERRFQPVPVEEPSEEETLRILEGIRSQYESYHSVQISEPALAAAVRLSARFLPERHQPDKAIDLLDEACARTRIGAPDASAAAKERLRKLYQEMGQAVTDPYRLGQLGAEEERLVREIERAESGGAHPVVDADAVAAVVQEWTNIPAGELSADERTRLRTLEDDLRRDIVGQDEALEKVARAVRRGRLGIGSETRPVGSFLFVGPSGCGKTALARALARRLFGSEAALVKIDMSEYMERHSVSRLIGAPPGYVGHDQGGQLTEALRRRPHCVLLFDEIEKAAEDVLNLLLQLLDDGVVTDSRGNKVAAKHAVVILTSNLGSREAAAQSDRTALGYRLNEPTLDEREHDRARIVERATKTLRPELLGRIETTVYFSPLGPASVERLIDIELAHLNERLARHYRIAVTVGPALRARLAREGFDPAYGARPLRRSITALIEDPLSSALLDEQVTEGQAVEVDLDAHGNPAVALVPAQPVQEPAG